MGAGGGQADLEGGEMKTVEQGPTFRIEERKIEIKVPDHGWESGAWELAEFVCQSQLARIYGSLEKGMEEIGKRAFSKWVDEVERSIESQNPRD